MSKAQQKCNSLIMLNYYNVVFVKKDLYGYNVDETDTAFLSTDKTSQLNFLFLTIGIVFAMLDQKNTHLRQLDCS